MLWKSVKYMLLLTVAGLKKKKNISARPIFWARKKTGVLNKVLTQSKKQLEMLLLDLY